jgi:superfamily II DNA or RNA helicase
MSTPHTQTIEAAGGEIAARPALAAEALGLSIPEKRMASGKTLRPYQAEAVFSVFKEAERARRAQATGSGERVEPCAISQPTAAGKSIEFYRLAQEVWEAWGWRTLVIVPTRVLARQTKRNAALELGEGWTVGQVGDGEFEVEGCRLVAAVAAALTGKKTRKKLEAVLAERFELVIFDECHHAASETWEQLLTELKRAAQLVVGVSATPVRGDGKSVASDRYFPKLVCYHSTGQLVEWGYLAKCYGYLVETGIALKNVRLTKRGDYNQEDLDAQVNTDDLNRLAVRAWQKYAEGRRTIAFCVSIKHAQSLAAMFREEGVGAEAVWGQGMKRKEQEGTLARHQQGAFPVLSNCMLTIEGYDDPAVSCVLLVRPMTKASAAVFGPQAFGRCMRLSEGKDYSVIIELMFEETSEERERTRAGAVLNGESEEAEGAAADKEVEKKKPRSVTAAMTGLDESEIDREGLLSIDELERIAKERERERERLALREALQRLDHVQEMFSVIERLSYSSAYAWVPLGDKAIHMSFGTRGDFIEVVQENPLRWAIYTSIGDRLELRGYASSREAALEQADEWLDMQDLNHYLTNRDEPWRKESPTSAQLARAKRLGLNVEILKQLARGQVSDLINSAQALLKRDPRQLTLPPAAPRPTPLAADDDSAGI